MELHLKPHPLLKMLHHISQVYYKWGKSLQSSTFSVFVLQRDDNNFVIHLKQACKCRKFLSYSSAFG